jgi:hypothetical protein
MWQQTEWSVFLQSSLFPPLPLAIPFRFLTAILRGLPIFPTCVCRLCLTLFSLLFFSSLFPQRLSSPYWHELHLVSKGQGQGRAGCYWRVNNAASLENVCSYVLRKIQRIRGPPLWSSCQSSWLQIRVRFPALPDFLRGPDRGPLSLLSTIEELLGRNSSGCGIENQNTAVGIRHADHLAPSIRKRWH